MSTYDAILGSALTKFSKLVKKPERYMQSDSDLFDEIKLLSKESIHTLVQYILGFFYIMKIIIIITIKPCWKGFSVLYAYI